MKKDTANGKIDAETKPCIHFIGIGGIGMSALARLMLSLGHPVSGSDLKENKQTRELSALGARLSFAHAAKNLPPNGTVVYSSGVAVDNVELVAARQKGFLCLHRQELLNALMAQKKCRLGVAGSHGKTTTSSLLVATCLQGNFSPSFALGGLLSASNLNAAWGEGDLFISELDESDRSFLTADVSGAILTNLDNDHLEAYGSLDALKDSFAQFARKVQDPSLLFYCQDDEALKSLSLRGVSYGFSPSADLQIVHFKPMDWSLHLDISFKGHVYPNVTLPLIGRHNALNALAVFGLALNLGIAEEEIRQAFKNFAGVHRRQEKKLSSPFLFIDDYAHHPKEIAATLQAMRQALPHSRLVAVLQPHRYSRVASCLEEFASSLLTADLAIVTDIYSAGEKADPEIQTRLFHALQQLKEVVYLPRASLAEQLLPLIEEGDAIVSLGAGDITHLFQELCQQREHLGIKWHS